MSSTDRERKKDEEGADPDIKVTDRRLFTMDGDLRQEIREEDDHKEERSETPAARTEADRGSAADAARGSGFERRSVEEPRSVDFTMLLNAMAQPALLFLGEIPNADGEAQVDLEQARIQIDMLELLKVKCRGNLSANEEGLLDRILYQLRMLYVARSGEPRG